VKGAAKRAPRFFLFFVVAMVLVCALSTLAQMPGGRVARAAVEIGGLSWGRAAARRQAKSRRTSNGEALRYQHRLCICTW